MNNYYIFYTNNLFSEFEIINSGESFTYKFINNKNLNFTKKFEENDILFICKKKDIYITQMILKIINIGNEIILKKLCDYSNPLDISKYIACKIENDIIQQIVAKTNRRVNESNPIVDTRLEDGSRVNVILPPIALEGPIVTIRKFSKRGITIDDMISWGTISKEAADFLKMAVMAGYNIFVSGGTGSGKTTFLNVLSNFIPKDERIVTIEDSAELKLDSVDNIVRMETRQANSQGENVISIRDLIKASLRVRPDRIIVGEVRGGETLDMLQAMNTGHDGSMSTGHGNSPSDMMTRLETMVLMGIDMPLAAIRAQIATAIDIVIHLGRMRDKTRKVLEINEVVGIRNGQIELNRLYVFKEEPESDKNKVVGQLERTENPLINKQKLERKGLA